MCGRLSQTTAAEKAARALETINELPALPPRYNVAPSLPLAAIRQSPQGRNEWVVLRWGLVPHWAKDAKAGYKMINAKAETLTQRPAYRTAFRYRRCIVPADGFYEWKRDNKTKQPYYIRRQADEPLYFAGLWEHWEGNGEVLESCAIVTTGPNPLVQPLHDRMPLILTAEEAQIWLDVAITDPRRLQPLLKPYTSDDLTAYPVTPAVNSPRFDDAQCISLWNEAKN